jgi:hypothetical protein
MCAFVQVRERVGCEQGVAAEEFVEGSPGGVFWVWRTAAY